MPQTNSADLALDSEWSQDLGWSASPAQQQQFQQLYQEILQGNQQLNLTRITAPAEFLEKHLWDSLRGVLPRFSEITTQPLSLIDVGAGAGFPGVPIAIACPNWQVTLLDATRKKVAFLETLTQTLHLPIQSLVGRAEQIGQSPQYRAAFDIATIRAVAAASICAEYTLPLLKLGGIAVLYRGQWLAEEAAALEPAVAALGGVIDQIEPCATPFSQGIRHCIYLKKIRPTSPEFPRLAGMPSQKPL
jgi:16S rRNA (guanine527-N7)-methyltransferase